MKEYQMTRGKSQALYKYLPESWIDFSIRGKYRKNYIAHVERWNSDNLMDINKKRIIRLVNQAVHSFANQAHTGGNVEPTSGFGAEVTVDTCDVLTPKAGGDERGIVAQISPLTFYCKKCHKVHQFKNVEDYKRNTKCRVCKNVELTQMRQIYYCKCGWATAEHPAYCRTHKWENIYWYGGYDFVCKSCNTKIPMRQKCKICGNILNPHPALDPAQYFAFSFTFVDLIDERIEDFISNTDYGAYVTIAHWMGKITDEELKDVIEKGIVSDPEVYQKKYESFYKLFLSLGEDVAKAAAKQAADKECGNGFNDIISELKLVLQVPEEEVKKFAEMLIEYNMVEKSDDISTLEDAKKVAQLLNTNANPDEFDNIAKKYGIVDTKVCGDIPFIACSYGYTREKSQYEEGVQLRAFKEEKHGKKNVYATKLRTEGVLFEFDRGRIIEWLITNKFLEEADAPNLDNEEEVKIWFVNNIHLGAITTFQEIDQETDMITSCVYGLIHSLSHLMVKAAAELCGLNKDSISEYIFPGIPAIMIYCQNSQGFNLGALFNVFEAYFDKWITNAATKADKCVFDPICIERYKACTGCLFLNEVSCQHFNQDLNRRLVIGYFDKIKKKKTYGFWEELE